MVRTNAVSRRPTIGLALAAIVALLAAMAVWAWPGSSNPGSAYVHAAVRDAAFHSEDGRVSVIIQSRGDVPAAARAVREADGTVVREFSIIPALEAEIPARAVDLLAANPAVWRISLNAPIEETDLGDDGDDGFTALLEAGEILAFIQHFRRDGATDLSDLSGERTPGGAARGNYADVVSVFPGAVRATDAWDEGATGSGVGVAVVDTGINNERSDLGRRLVASYGTSGVDTNHDFSGHGTHVAGIVAGDGAHSGARFMGIAPEANVVAVKVGRYGATPTMADAIEGLQIVLQRRTDHNIRVANLSFTSSVPESYLVNPLNAAVEQLWFNGIVVVASVGNRGSEPFAVDRAPANDPWVISVGAFSDNDTIDPSDDAMKDWSSRGRTHDGINKPDVVAPGSRLIASVGSPLSELYLQYPENRVGPHYFRMGGTSAAAPVVAGVAALILDQHPQLSPDEVKARIVRNSQPMPGSAAPRIDAYAAVFGPDAGRANQGTIPTNIWVDRATGQIRSEPVLSDGLTWDGLTWDGLTWEGLTWEGLTWEGLTWEGLTWEGLTWEGLTWEGLTWEGLTWDGLTWEGLTWEGLTWEGVTWDAIVTD